MLLVLEEKPPCATGFPQHGDTAPERWDHFQLQLTLRFLTTNPFFCTKLSVPGT